MKRSNCIFSLLAATVVLGDALAGIRVGNLSRNYAGSSKNTLALEQQYYNSVAGIDPDVPVQVDLPIPVANAELAEQIKSGGQDATTDMETLNRCAMIYPEGEFVWDKPTIGRGAGGAPTCVSVVEVRAIGANGPYEHTVVARGKLAAGDSIRCNISDFPAHTYLPDVANVLFPADNPPTREDVIQVMNEEQKNKAGLKIAAAALIGGIGGNLVGKSEIGEDKLLGTNSEKMKTTAIGAAAGAALMAASTYSGKVAGDVILHTGVNAAAGGVVGNMMAAGDSVLRIEKCTYNNAETTCLWGTLQKQDKLAENEKVFASWDGRNTVFCKDPANYTQCERVTDLHVTAVAGESVNKKESDRDKTKVGQIYYFNAQTNKMTTDRTETGVGENPIEYYDNVAATRGIGARVMGLIVNFSDSAFGVKTDKWEDWKKTNGKTAIICRRDAKGTPIECNAKNPETGESLYTINEFDPLKVDVDDGGVIDFSNKARTASTLKGAGIGGALGGFSGYQGAQSDIEERFTQATREYNDSLEKIYCGTGKKFLSYYNDDAIIPTMK